MRRILSTSLLFLTIAGGTALADRHHGGGGRHGGHGGGGRPAVVVRGGGHVSGGVVVRSRPVYRGTVRPNRRVVVRRNTYVSDGYYVLGTGARIRYSRPVIRQRYYDVRYRPTVIVENYPSQPGYIWVQGQWTWDGYEWQWQSGYYAPDPQYQTYYDDGSWE